jgi:uncharacterized membrane protein YedE/YeeE
MTLVVAFASGLLFAIGLVLSGMTEPGRIMGFLDVVGVWDPSLLFVMVGAIGVFAPLYRLSLRRPRPMLAATFHVPGRATIDGRLLGGAALFGIGWGLSGFCPGPAVVSAGTLALEPVLFVLAILVGMQAFRLITSRSDDAPEDTQGSAGQNVG